LIYTKTGFSILFARLVIDNGEKNSKFLLLSFPLQSLCVFTMEKYFTHHCSYQPLCT